LANAPEIQTEDEQLQDVVSSPVRSRYASFWQIVRFGIVGIFNTAVDVLTLNLLLWRFPTHNANFLLLYNLVAYTLGALNSYVLNKYWTFHYRQAITGSELLRFVSINVIGIVCNSSILWIAARIFHPLIADTILWANASKFSAIIGTTIINYLGMRFWVFAAKSQESGRKRVLIPIEATDVQKRPKPVSVSGASSGANQAHPETEENAFRTSQSLSVILPAYNEEAAIAGMLHTVIATLTPWVQHFEVIVVNDGSKDNTRTIVEDIVVTDPRVRIINHHVNQGYGAALVSGFEAVTKDLVFFMDSDGQFDISDLEPFFPLIEIYNAVLGYRIERRDTWVRKLNAWGWKLLVRAIFGLRVRDVDCAFKLYRADFFRKHRLETRGAMINTEILHKLKRFGYTYTQLGVRHLPRRSGRATGAKLSVIMRAFRELFIYAWKWHREEQKEKSHKFARR
jgi:putative flippase GtrA